MTAGVVCFPTRWSPAAKIGRSMAQIHDPVPRYDTIAPAVDRLFEMGRAGREAVSRGHESRAEAAKLAELFSATEHAR